MSLLSAKLHLLMMPPEKTQEILEQTVVFLGEYVFLIYSAVHNSGATLRHFSILLFQAIFIHLYELCIYMLYIFVKGMLQVI